MCKTQNILDNINNLIKNAILSDDLLLKGKLKQSYDRKKVKMVKPSAILKLVNNKEITVNKIIKKTPYDVKFIGVCNNISEEYSQSDIMKYIKDANCKYAITKKKVKIVRVYTSLRKYTLEEFVSICSQMFRVSPRKAQWLKIINAGKLQCPVTGKKVAYCSYDISQLNSYHYNFYSEDGQLFTIDHIIPKSEGGSLMKLKNIQPMIGKYNWKKGSQNNNEFISKIKSKLNR